MGFLDHEGGAEFPYHKKDVFEALVEAIPTIPGMRVSQEDLLSGHILAKAGMSMASWGENIPISVSEISPGRTRISITSTPKTGLLFGGAFDLGKNRRNIEKILKGVSTILSQKPPVTTDTLLPQTPIDPAQRILRLKDLFDKGLIDKNEFEKKKAEILSEM